MKRRLCAAACACLLLAGCGGVAPSVTQETTAETIVETAEEITLEDYMVQISDAVAKIDAACIPIGNMAIYEVKYWKNLNEIRGNVSSSDVVEPAIKWIEKNSDYTKESMDADYKANGDTYKNIVLSPIPENAQKLYDLYDAYYTAYSKFYNHVMAPSGTLNTFAMDGNDLLSAINDTKAQLDTLIG